MNRHALTHNNSTGKVAEKNYFFKYFSKIVNYLLAL